ncbi:hypothetical protein JCM10369A_44530 [Nocardioides pyridinolyticus]
MATDCYTIDASPGRIRDARKKNGRVIGIRLPRRPLTLCGNSRCVRPDHMGPANTRGDHR